MATTLDRDPFASAQPTEADLVLGPTAEFALPQERAAFLVRTYAHLLGAVLAFIGLEAAWFGTPVAAWVVSTLAWGRSVWLVYLAAFLGVSVLADRWARSTTSRAVQYAGLGLYVMFESILFVPLLVMALVAMSRPDGDPLLLPRAALVSGGLFAGLSAVVFLTRRDFSFLRSTLIFGGLAAMGLIVASVVFDFELGLVYSYAMVAFACCWILYDTSKVLRSYRTSQHVAASLALFAGAMLLFWYVLRIFLARRR